MTVAGPGVCFLLRPWSTDDAEGFRAAVDEDVDHVRPWLSWTLEEPRTVEATRALLRGWAEAFARGDAWRYAVVPADDVEQVLGGVNLQSRVGPDAHDVGWWLRRSATGRGVAGAAVARLIVHAFADRRVARVVAHCDPGNERSLGFARALGCLVEGEVRYAWPDGRPRPVVRLAMDRAGWNSEEGRLRRWAERVVLGGGAG